MIDLARHGPWALVVGGSEGIGAGFARRLADAGFKLVLVARKVAPLEDLAAELRGRGAEVRYVSVDLAGSDPLDAVRAITDDFDVGLLVYNAGATSDFGNYVELEPAAIRRVLAVNVTAVSEFVRHFGGLMRARGRGGIVTCGSAAAFIGSPTLATYSGAKAFMRTWSEALWAECRPLGIDVLHLMIRLTATPAMLRLGWPMDDADQPDEVVAGAFAHLGDGPIHYMGGDAAVAEYQQRCELANRGAVVLGGAWKEEDMAGTT